MTCPCGGAFAFINRAPQGDLYGCTRCGLERWVAPPTAPIPPRTMRRMLSAAMGGQRAPQAHQIKQSSR